MPKKFNGHFATPPEYIRMQSRFIGVIGMVFSYGAMLSVSDKSVSGNKPPIDQQISEITYSRVCYYVIKQNVT